MHSKNQLMYGIVSFALAFSAACGALGEKENDDPKIEFSTDSSGCLNEFSEDFEAFLEGTVDERKWSLSLDCVVDALDTFREFGRGELEDGYSKRDIHSLVSNVLLTDREVPVQLIEAGLELKASLLGGSPTSLSFDGLDRTIDLVNFFKAETGVLIPHLFNRKNNPTEGNLIGLMNSLDTFVIRTGDFFGQRGSEGLSKTTANSLVVLINEVLEYEIDTVWVDRLFLAKEFMLGGSETEIENGQWPRLFGLIAKLGSSAAALTRIEKTDGLEGDIRFYRFLNTVMEKARIGVDQILANNGDKVRFSKLDELLDEIPEDTLDVNREIFDSGYRLLTKKILFNDDSESLLKATIDDIFDQFYRFTYARIHSSEIFKQYGLNQDSVEGIEFGDVARDYLEGFDGLEREVIANLVEMAEEYIPVFTASDLEVTFVPNHQNSLNNIQGLALMNQIALRLLKSYSKVEDSSYVTAEDVEELFNDFGLFAQEFNLVDFELKGWPRKRFGEGDMFTLASDGNRKVDIVEGTYLLGTLFSVVSLRNRVFDELQDLCESGDGLDPLGFKWMNFECFQREFFARADNFFGNFPELQELYLTADAELQEEIQTNLERASRRFGVTDFPIGQDDANDLMGIIHYMETAFARFDSNDDRVLNKQEVQNATPTFFSKIAELGGLDEDKEALVNTAFAWLVEFGEEPLKGSVADSAKFLWWWARGPRVWKINATRRNLYKIGSYFNEPEPIPPGGWPYAQDQ